MAVALIIAGLVVDIWLLILVHRQGVRKHLPWFACYVAWGVSLAVYPIGNLAHQPSLVHRCVLVDGVHRSSFDRQRRPRKFPANISGIYLGGLVSLGSMEHDPGGSHILGLESRLCAADTK